MMMTTMIKKKMIEKKIRVEIMMKKNKEEKEK